MPIVKGCQDNALLESSFLHKQKALAARSVLHGSSCCSLPAICSSIGFVSRQQ